jgi:hypothetical protein
MSSKILLVIAALASIFVANCSPGPGGQTQQAACNQDSDCAWRTKECFAECTSAASPDTPSTNCGDACCNASRPACTCVNRLCTAEPTTTCAGYCP